VRAARAWHAVTAVVAIAALVVQLVLVVQGGRVLDEVQTAPLDVRLYRYAAYFTIQSNLLVAITAVTLARDPLRDGRLWRVLRTGAVLGIAVTGIVHFTLLRPLLHLHGMDWLTDKTLHLVVPLLAVIGWVLFGPRPRIDLGTAVRTLLWPIAWTVWTLVVGGLTGWYPYPFLDHREDGVATVVVACVGITVLFVAILALLAWLDRRFRLTPASG
jgi:hypothetical protein